MIDDRRGRARRRIIKGAQIALNRGAVLDCTIRDISATSARLKIASPVGIPDTFDLIIPGEAARPCRVVRRKPDQIGVEFA
jgi:hypothetical protein